MDGDQELGELVRERRRLVALGYRMLGTVGEAEDAVQETYIRWYRLSEAERASIGNVQAWLTRVAGRICLDMLGSARARREVYVGPWLPEPLPAGWFSGGSAPDPADRVTLDEAVSSALLVVLEAMTPAQRVAFVLHDIFGMPFEEVAGVGGRSPQAVRKLASDARKRVREDRADTVGRAEHDATVAAFAAACAEGDLAGLVTLLDPAVALRSDGGGIVSAARNPVRGPDAVARFMIGIATRSAPGDVVPRPTADGTALVWQPDGHVRAVLNLRVRAGVVTDVWIQMNPEKLATWNG